MDLKKSIWWRPFQTFSYGLLCWLTPFLAHAVTLEWDRNPETNVLGYRVYVGRQSRVYDSVLDVDNQIMAQFAAVSGKYYFAVTAYDTEGLESDFSDEVSYTPPRTNSAPTAYPDPYVAIMNVPLSVSAALGLLNNDLEPDGDPMSVLLVSSVTNGGLTLNADGSFVYTPAQGFAGVDSFSYATTDGSATSAVTAVTIVVNDNPPPSQNCVDCFADLDGLLTAQSNRFRPVIEARLAVPTNVTCPRLGVLIFSTVSRAARTMNDPQMNAALDSAAECLVFNLRQEAAARSMIASGLSPSKWTAAASNQIGAALKNLDRVLLSSNRVARAPMLAAAAAFLPRADKSIATGNRAPLSLANKMAICKVTERGQKSQISFDFGNNSFSVEDENGIIGVGQYTFARTAWNEGSLVLGFEHTMLGYDAGESMTLQLKFGRTRHRLKSERLRGYFTLQ